MPSVKYQGGGGGGVKLRDKPQMIHGRLGWEKIKKEGAGDRLQQ
jgi:hypothetical protein